MAGLAPLISSNMPDLFGLDDIRMIDLVINESAERATNDQHSALLRNGRFEVDPNFAPGGAKKLALMVGSNLPAEVAEGAAIPESTPAIAWTKTLNTLAYKNIATISKEAYRRDPRGEIRRATENVMSQYMDTLNQIAGELYKNALAGSGGARYQTGDGDYLFSDSHSYSAASPLYGAADQDNKAALALTAPNMTTAVAALRVQKGENGLIKGCRPKTLLVAPDLETEARVIGLSVNAPGAFLSSQLATSLNPFAGSIQIASNDFLTAKSWFLIDNDKCDVHMVASYQPEFSVFVNEYKDLMHFKIAFELTWGACDWRGVYGSQGS